MNCPKCNAELKPGARFCHVCGFDVKSEMTTQMPVNPTPPPTQQPPQPQYQQPYQQPQPQPQPQYQYQQQQQQFSYQRQQQPAYAPQAMPKSGSSGSMIAGIVALVGAVGVFLPWIRFSFWGISGSSSAFDVWQGKLILILLIASGIFGLLGNSIKMDSKAKGIIMLILPIFPIIFSLYTLFDIIGTEMVSVGIGLFLTLLTSIGCLVIGLTSVTKPQVHPNLNPQNNQLSQNMTFQQPQSQPQPYSQPQYQQQPYGQQQYAVPYPGQKAQQSKGTMAIVCFFIGGWGIHRLMMGYSNWWLMIITLGGLGIWTLIDFIRILTGDMKMADGRPLL